MKAKIVASPSKKIPVLFSLVTGDELLPVPLKGVKAPTSPGQTVLLEQDKGQLKVAVSVGKRDGAVLDAVRRAGGAAAKWLRTNGKTSGAVDARLPKGMLSDANSDEVVRALVEGLHLGAFQFEELKSNGAKAKTKVATVEIVVARASTRLNAVLREAAADCAGVNLARELSHQPPNIINPITLVKRARQVAQKSGLKCTVLDHRQLAQKGMNAFVAVGQGSKTPSRMIVLEYRPKGTAKKAPVLLVGKSITFDTGGYSLKPRDGMLGMKYDKCGGMAVLGIMQAVAERKLNVPVVGILAAAENMVAGDAYRPDDIIKTMCGKTVEIVSADAEGRLVLCDSLTYGQRTFKPRCVIDLATLTGGVVVALGKSAAGIFSNDEDLQDKLVEAGRATHERLWPLPVWDEYFDLIRGDDSDMKNSAGREAHATQGGIFLKQFVEEGMPWVHLDIAGVASVDKAHPYCVKGATGFGVRLVMNYLSNLKG